MLTADMGASLGAGNASGVPRGANISAVLVFVAKSSAA